MSTAIRNQVKLFGRGAQPMLFAHGFGCDQPMWRWVTPAFEDDYRPHRPGHRLLLDAIGHCPPMSAPAATIAAIRRYLAQPAPLSVP